MTVDEIRERIIGPNVNVTCPECGAIHLTREEAEEAALRKITSSARYLRIKAEAQE
jgi:predicted  nucleic acid-binding Zn-ribbon protein